MISARARCGGLLAAAAVSIAVAAEAGEAPPNLDDIVPALLPTVVNIYSMKITSGSESEPIRTAAATHKKQSLGSGFIIDPAGIIVTNEHMIQDAYDISVTLQDNTTLKAQLIGATTGVDIALLRVHASRPLPAVKLGDSRKLRVGQRIFAIGNSEGYGSSVSAGIVSALNRDIMMSPYDDYIQTDAAINHGNSGGPLFNMDGEVIGVSTAFYSPPGEEGSVGLGFAIPWNDADFVVRQLLTNGRVQAGYIGVDLQQVTSDIAAAVGLPAIEGAIINGVETGEPAERAGLRQGDVILKADGKDLSDARAVARAIAVTPPGQRLDLDIWRDAKSQAIPVVVTEWPGDQQQSVTRPVPRPPTTPDLGLQLSAMTEAYRELYKLPHELEGVLVTGVAPLSPADDRGLHVGDVIKTVQMVRVNAPADVMQKFAGLRQQGKPDVLLLVWTDNAVRSVALPLEAG